jgi:hypothetical protein
VLLFSSTGDDVAKIQKLAREEKKERDGKEKMKRVFGIGRHKNRTIFGASLEEVMRVPSEQGRGLPSVVEDTLRVLEQQGLSAEGLFRKSPSAKEVDALKRLYDGSWARATALVVCHHLTSPSSSLAEGQPADRKKYALQVADPITVGSLLKLWLRELPDPLLTKALYGMFIDAGANEDEKARVANLRLLVKGLPLYNRNVLRPLLALLQKVALHSEINKMTAENLAIIFAPTLLSSANLADTQSSITVTLALITHQEAIFDGTPVSPLPQTKATSAALQQQQAPCHKRHDSDSDTDSVASKTVRKSEKGATWGTVFSLLAKEECPADEEEDGEEEEEEEEIVVDAKRTSKKRKTDEGLAETTAAVDETATEMSLDQSVLD